MRTSSPRTVRSPGVSDGASWRARAGPDRRSAGLRRRSPRRTPARTIWHGVRHRYAMGPPSSRGAAGAAALAEPLGGPTAALADSPGGPRGAPPPSTVSSEKCHRVNVDSPLVPQADAAENNFGMPTAQHDLRAVAPRPLRRERGCRPEHLGVGGGGLPQPFPDPGRSPFARLDLLPLPPQDPEPPEGRIAETPPPDQLGPPEAPVHGR